MFEGQDRSERCSRPASATKNGHDAVRSRGEARRTRRLALAIAFAMIATAPVAGAFTPAHPHSHAYEGSSHVEAGSPQDAFLVAGANTGCVDANPIAEITPLPPKPASDGDPETGVGVLCFGFKTRYGNDTGHVVRVTLIESLAQTPVRWLTCVDENGDGLCSRDAGDQVDLCATGTQLFASEGSVSLTHGGNCTVYEDPAAVDPTVHVFVLSSADATASTNVAIGGECYLEYEEASS